MQQRSSCASLTPLVERHRVRRREEFDHNVKIGKSGSYSLQSTAVELQLHTWGMLCFLTSDNPLSLLCELWHGKIHLSLAFTGTALYSSQTESMQTPKLLLLVLSLYLVPILREFEIGASSHQAMCRYVGVSLLSPAAAPAPRCSCYS